MSAAEGSSGGRAAEVVAEMWGWASMGIGDRDREIFTRIRGSFEGDATFTLVVSHLHADQAKDPQFYTNVPVSCL